MPSELDSVENPRKWRFTWEAQSHIPTLRLLLFDSYTNPSLQCQNLKVHLNLQQSVVCVAWLQDLEMSIRVPMPPVLVDAESPLSFRAFEDHIEVKLVLLLPVDHPIILNFNNVLDFSEKRGHSNSKALKPLSMDYDQSSLSRSGGVHFYCRNCSFRLSESPLRNFVEMPSVNWREVADNWFGTCCCSFGGISEKLVTRYTNSYRCAKGVCLLTLTTITLYKDDLIGHAFPDYDGTRELKDESDFTDGNWSTEAKQESQCNHTSTGEVKSKQFNYKNLVAKTEGNAAVKGSDEVDSPLVTSIPDLHQHGESNVLHDLDRDCMHHTCGTYELDPKPINTVDVSDDQISFLNGFLGNIFMARLSNLSADFEWAEFFCPQCSTLIGAYPCRNGCGPTDGGVRLFKCYVSTCLSTEPENLFREYTLEKMFASQLLESANEESSFRTVVKELKTKSTMLHIVLINSNSWSCSGYCLGMEDTAEVVPKVDLNPIIKVLFSDCNKSAESHLRKLEEWVTKDIAEEVFMLAHQIEELNEILVSRNDTLPSSCSSLDGLTLTSILR
ncbi:hypothetical protein SDJN02_03846 [Cucurbita argyrosperma subsp. argyrosperma]|nr:hypothetical protein SDJN02_03846 [Cucurbita argyrosperma subsp. argyrosperma]